MSPNRASTETLTSSSASEICADKTWFNRPIIVLTIFAIPLLAQITPWWYPTDDAIGYLSMAHTITDGGPVRTLGFRALHYAIGYPILIAPTFLISKIPIVEVIAENFVFALFTGYGIYVWIRKYVSNTALLLTGLTLWNVSYWDLYRQPLSETAFLCSLIWSAIACRRLLEAQGMRQIILMTIVTAVSMIVLSSIRQVGIFLAAGYGMSAILKSWRGEMSWGRTIGSTLCVGIPASIILVWLLLVYRAMSAGESDAHTYLDLIIDRNMSFAEQTIESIRLRTAEVGRLLLPGLWKAYADYGEWLNINTILYFVFCGMMLMAWWKLVQRDRDPLMLCAPFYVAFYSIWPFDQGTRFMTPLLPVLWLCAWELLRPWFKSLFRPLVILLIAHFVQSAFYFGLYVVSAQPCHQDLYALVHLVHRIGEDRNSVCGVGVSLQTEMLTNLVLDRRIAVVKADQSPPDTTKWVVTQSDKIDVKGFSIAERSGRMTLFARNE